MKFYEETIRIETATGKPQADTLLTYSRFLLVLGRPEECEKLISRALTLKPGSRDAHYERARLMLSRGDSREAAVEAERALTLPPPGVADRQIRYLLVRAYGLIGDEKQAQKHAAALRQEDAVR
jgi:tetratricopeptide (TPR) repeat protein